MIRVSVSDNFTVDYDKERGMYRVSIFENNHFKDEYWFDAYEDKEINSPANNNMLGIFNSPSCDKCSNNPKNGGSGFCNCTLGTPIFK
jgi:hypothetical protein